MTAYINLPKHTLDVNFPSDLSPSREIQRRVLHITNECLSASPEKDDVIFARCSCGGTVLPSRVELRIGAVLMGQ
jgi:hypothetical protein